jgi:hypothetical protein
LLIGKSPDSFQSSQLTDFLLTTEWAPGEASLQAYKVSENKQIKMNQNFSEVMAQYELPHNESPLKWSAGLLVEKLEKSPLQWTAIGLTHPYVIKDTIKYLHRKDLMRTRNLWPIAFLPQFLAGRMMRYFSHFSGGQNYTDVTLNVFKRQGGLCLTSFEMFNHGTASVHQLPWMANIGGNDYTFVFM